MEGRVGEKEQDTAEKVGWMQVEDSYKADKGNVRGLELGEEIRRETRTARECKGGKEEAMRVGRG